MIVAALGFARDVLRTLTWQKLLLVQLLAGALDVFVLLLNVSRPSAPPTFSWSRPVIEETMAFSMLFAVLIADQLVARGARHFRTYALAIIAASVFSGVTQFEIRDWFGLYTRLDRPGVEAAVRRTQMVYAACDTLTYGVIFIVVYLDYRRRERLLRRVRAAELERARSEQHIVRSQLTALRTDVDAVELLATLDDLRRGFENDRTDVDTRLDEVIASLRSKLAPAEPDPQNAPRMSTTALIAEDEPLLRAELREGLAALWPELEICAETGDGAATLLALERHRPTILFLDIHMPGITGLEIAEQVGGRSHVVFVTAFSEHATAAFEQGALDYVVKPFSIARLAKTVTRLKERVRTVPADLTGLMEVLRSAAPVETKYVRWLTVPHNRELRVVTTEEICYLRAANKYTSLFTANAEYLLTNTLKAMREKVDPRSFWQIHRSFVVNVAAIQTIHRSFHGSFEVQLKQRRELLPVSEAYSHLFRQM